MLMHEWNMDTALAVRFEEGMEIGMERGIEQGMERGIEQGMEQGMRDVAMNALAAGATPEFVQKITGLDIETIENLAG
jgi:predicted transposase/invertase (TIGR01784 family)